MDYYSFLQRISLKSCSNEHTILHHCPTPLELLQLLAGREAPVGGWGGRVRGGGGEVEAGSVEVRF